MVAGLIVLLPALRIKGSYFALVTLAYMELMYQLVQVVRPDLTGGTRGISGIKTLTRGAENGYYMSLTLLILIAFSMWLLMRTRLGTALSAIGMNEESVQGSGLNTTKLKAFAFLTSAFVAGLSGAFYVHYVGSLAPRAMFEITFVFSIIVAALIGGASTIIGPIIGAYFLTFLLEYLRLFGSKKFVEAYPILETIQPALQGQGRYFIYGLIALLLYMYQPKGIVELVMRGFRRLTPRRAQ